MSIIEKAAGRLDRNKAEKPPVHELSPAPSHPFEQLEQFEHHEPAESHFHHDLWLADVQGLKLYLALAPAYSRTRGIFSGGNNDFKTHTGPRHRQYPVG